MFISFIFFGGSLFPCPQAFLKRLTLLSRREQRYWSNTFGSPLYLVLILSEDEQLFHCWDGESDIPQLHFSIYMFELLRLLCKCGLLSPHPPHPTSLPAECMSSILFNYIYMEDTSGLRCMVYLLQANLQAHLLVSLILQLSERGSYSCSWLSNCFISSFSLNRHQSLDLGESIFIIQLYQKKQSWYFYLPF